MVWWWWILPGAAALAGALLLLSGLGALFRGRFLGAFGGVLFGGGFLAAGVAAILLGLNIQSYARLTHERPVATITLSQIEPQFFEATLTQPETAAAPALTAVYPVHGDEWRIEAQVLRWKPWANILGLDAQYRLDRLSGRYRDTQQELTAVRSVHDLRGGDVASEGRWTLDVWDVSRRYRDYVDAVDTLYGSAAYMPMADGARYEVWITQSGLIARPVNEQARDASAGGWVQAD
ncbi:MAG: hypothetical protein V7678_09700 [Brevundimonas sp.]